MPRPSTDPDRRRRTPSPDDDAGAGRLTPLLDARATACPTSSTTSDALVRGRRGASRAGTGPVAIDAERASGYRYGQRAYLVQMRREGSGTWLIDPIALPRPLPAR